jgi:hypothetical protein
MGFLKNLVDRVTGAAPTSWTLVEALPDPDPAKGLFGKPFEADEHYVEIYLESMRLEKARRFATTFDGVVYAYMGLARQGEPRAEIAAVSKPENLGGLNDASLQRVITVQKRLLPATPWRGNPLALELGLFSVRTGDVLTPLIGLVTEISAKAGVSTAAMVDPLMPLVTKGLDLIAGQTKETEIELAIDTDATVDASRLMAIVAAPRGTYAPAGFSVDPADRRLLHDGVEVRGAYCVFSIRRAERNADWGAVAMLQQAYADLVAAIRSGREAEAREALAAFSRACIVCPDLIDRDGQKLREKAKAMVAEAFGGGAQARGPQPESVGMPSLRDLNLYDE